MSKKKKEKSKSMNENVLLSKISINKNECKDFTKIKCRVKKTNID